MNKIAEIFREFSDINEEEINIILRESAYLQLVSDLSYSDILLYCLDQSKLSVIVAAHYTPNTALSIYDKDLTGKMYSQNGKPLVFSAFKLSQIQKGEQNIIAHDAPVQVEAIPIRAKQKNLAVISKETYSLKKKRAGEMETTYMNISDELTDMIFNQEIDKKLPSGFITSKEAGDGIIKLDKDIRITYATPNAVSIYKQLGISRNLTGKTLKDLGINEKIIKRAINQKKPIQQAVNEKGLYLLIRVIPLIAKGEISGVLSLVRDISDIKDREEKLRTKEVIIKEIHHRVKNNLQSIISLLRMQLRRTDNDEVKLFLQEGINRIESISTVHDILSHTGHESIDFNSIINVIIDNLSKQTTTDSIIDFQIIGEAGQISSRQATSLALVVNELVQNSLEHAFIGIDKGKIMLVLNREKNSLNIKIADDGIGFSDNKKSKGLGLQIVQNLVEHDLKGKIEIKYKKGTEVDIKVPLEKERYFEEVI